MKSYKLAKYNIKSSLKSIIIYYCIMIAVLTSISIMSKFSGGNTQTSGIEFASMIFLFVMGLNFFKENFYFTQANNISRENYLKSVAITILPIALAMSVLDVIINRVYNLFEVCPTIYDMAYDKISNFSLRNKEIWIQSNSMVILFRTVMFLMACYILVFAIGLLITMIYYRCNKIMKILVSLSPIVISFISGGISYIFPEYEIKAEALINNILGLSTGNSYMAVMTFICLFLIVMTFAYMFVRKAVVKRV